MDRVKGILKQLRALVRKEAVERELDEELRFHVEMQTEENVRRGMDPTEARRRAMIEFGGVERFKEEVREARWTRWFEDIAQDVRYAARTLAKRPGFTAAGVLTLALGIGATTVMFGVVDALFLSPPPGVHGADDLVRLYIVREEGRVTTGPGGGGGSYPDFVTLRQSARGLDDVAAFDWTAAIDLDLGAEARRITGQLVTENFFDVLGVRPDAGRFFIGADSAAAANPTVVLAYGFARRRFGDAREAVDRTLLLNGTTVTVVGVAPARFSGIEPRPVDVWLPAAKGEALGLAFDGWKAQHLAVALRYVARLEPGASVERVEASAAAALRNAAERVDGLDPDPGVIAGPFITARGPKRSEPASVALWVALATGLLLLIACANVANLLLARAATRRREIAVRLSLGVGRGRLVRQLLTESVLLAGLGCVAGLALAFLGAELVRQFPLPPAAGRLNGRMLGFAGGVAVLTGLLFGLAPALQAVRTDAVAGLKESERTQPHGRTRLRGALVAAQAALALVALVGAGLFLRSFERAASIDPGIEIDRVAMVSVDLANAGYGAVEQEAFVSRAAERLLAAPGVEGVAQARVTPLSGTGYIRGVHPPGGDSIVVERGPYANWVTGDFTRTLGLRLVDGRTFTDADVEGAQPVAILSAELAALVAPGGRAVGRCVEVTGRSSDFECTRIVGVVENVNHVLLGEPAPYVFLPWAQHPGARAFGSRRLYVRTAGDPRQLAGELRSVVRGIAPDLPYVSVEPMTSIVESDLLPFRLGATLSTLFGILALALAAVGLYGVLGYFVAQRTPEIGIRRSLGARDGHVVRLVVGQGMTPVAIGAAVGLAAAFALTRFLESLLFGVSPTDPVAIGVMTVLLFGVAVGASWLPARRAARVDPMTALRAE